MATTIDIALVYDTLLASPGMNDKLEPKSQPGSFGFTKINLNSYIWIKLFVISLNSNKTSIIYPITVYACKIRTPVTVDDLLFGSAGSADSCQFTRKN
jgi:hypothetical protein